MLTQFGDQVGAGQLGMTHREVVVDRERMRYVRRVPDPDHRRARLIQIDKRGRQAAKAAQVAHDQIQAEWRSHIGARRFNQLRETLEDLRDTDPFAATSE